MRHTFLALIVCLALFSCKKEYSGNATAGTGNLAGRWRMISVKDNSANAVTTKPSSISGDVDITFTFSSAAAGTMSGVTPTNDLSAGYVVGSNSLLSISEINRSKVIETSWGELFLDNIPYSQNFSFDNTGNLLINSSTHKTLAFLRQ